MSEPRNGQERDRELGELLRAQLSAPPLRPGFHEELEQRLAAVPSSAIASPRRRHLRRSTRRLLALVAVVAAASVIAFAVLPLLQRGSTATAADMVAAMTSAGRHTKTLALNMVITNRNELFAFTSDGRVRLVLDTAGDVLATGREVHTWGGENPGRSERESTSSYDASLHEARSRSGRPDRRQTTHVHRPAWQADLGVDPYFLSDYSYDTLAASFRAKLAELDPSTAVRESTYLGRPVWIAELTEKWPANPDQKVDIFVYWDITVDKATGLLLAVQPRLEAAGEVSPAQMSLRVVRIETDPQLPEGWQLPALPKEGKVVVTDEGTRFGTPEEVAKRSWPTLPLIPQRVPAGYVRTDVASTAFDGASQNGEWSPPQHYEVVRRSGRFTYRRSTLSPLTVLTRFRREYSSFVVEVSPKKFGESLTPLTPSSRSDVQSVTLTGGYLEGAEAHTWIGPYQGEGPTLIAYSDRSLVRITGDLTRQELIDVANSMMVYGDVNRPLLPGFGQ